MPHEGESSVVSRDWLIRAKGNLLRAKQPKPEGAFWEDLCFDAQQAAEKAVKSVLIFWGVDFPKTHDITDLLVLLRESGHEPPQELWEAGRLSNYAVTTRYPGIEKPVTEEEYQLAVRLTEKVVMWAEGIIGHAG